MISEQEWAVALEVARNYTEYGSYRKSPKQAVKALRRRCPTLADADGQFAFDECVALLAAAIDVVEAHKDELRELSNAGGKNVWTGFAGELRTRRPDVPESICGNALGWVWFWHHLK